MSRNERLNYRKDTYIATNGSCLICLEPGKISVDHVIPREYENLYGFTRDDIYTRFNQTALCDFCHVKTDYTEPGKQVLGDIFGPPGTVAGIIFGYPRSRDLNLRNDQREQWMKIVETIQRRFKSYRQGRKLSAQWEQYLDEISIMTATALEDWRLVISKLMLLLG